VIASNDPAALRAKAVFALRFMPGDAASQLLTSSLRDPESQVRVAAAQAIQLRASN
jgi:HEAT repeat protein